MGIMLTQGGGGVAVVVPLIIMVGDGGKGT